jgi:hypothetical protein
MPVLCALTGPSSQTTGRSRSPATGCRTLGIGPSGRGGYPHPLGAQRPPGIPARPGLPRRPSACIGRSTQSARRSLRRYAQPRSGDPLWQTLRICTGDIRPGRKIHEINLSNSRVEVSGLEPTSALLTGYRARTCAHLTLEGQSSEERQPRRTTAQRPLLTSWSRAINGRLSDAYDTVGRSEQTKGAGRSFFLATSHVFSDEGRAGAGARSKPIPPAPRTSEHDR